MGAFLPTIACSVVIIVPKERYNIMCSGVIFVFMKEALCYAAGGRNMQVQECRQWLKPLLLACGVSVQVLSPFLEVKQEGVWPLYPAATAVSPPGMKTEGPSVWCPSNRYILIVRSLVLSQTLAFAKFN